jgi:hypothetical protein
MPSPTIRSDVTYESSSHTKLQDWIKSLTSSSKCADILINRLYYIFSVILKLDLYYDLWKQFTMMVLQKPGKPRYNVPKAYRPIALLNTIAKLLLAIIAEQLMFCIEKHSLLPHNHFGGRAKWTTLDMVHVMD